MECKSMYLYTICTLIRHHIELKLASIQKNKLFVNKTAV